MHSGHIQKKAQEDRNRGREIRKIKFDLHQSRKTGETSTCKIDSFKILRMQH